MDFELTDEQAMFRDSVQRWVEKDYGFERRQAIARGPESFSREKWAEMAELGWLAAALPEADGGLGFSAIEVAVIAEELGRALVLEPYLPVAVLAAKLIELAGSPERRADLLPAIGSGESIVALAHDEHDARGEIAWVETRASRDGSGYRLDGRKTMILAGHAADRLIVSARTAGKRDDPDGISLFLVDPAAPGLARRDYQLIDGSRACDVELDGVSVDADALIGGEGGGFAPLATARAHALVALCAEAIGVMDRALWITRDYLKTRQQFGVAIGSFQALQHRAADMYVAVEQARAMVQFGLSRLDAEPGERDLAMAGMKAQIGQLGHFVCGQAIQLHGGIGVTEEYVIGHHFKRMTVIESLFGHSQAHLAAVASALRAA